MEPPEKKGHTPVNKNTLKLLEFLGKDQIMETPHGPIHQEEKERGYTILSTPQYKTDVNDILGSNGIPPYIPTTYLGARVVLLEVHKRTLLQAGKQIVLLNDNTESILYGPGIRSVVDIPLRKDGHISPTDAAHLERYSVFAEVRSIRAIVPPGVRVIFIRSYPSTTIVRNMRTFRREFCTGYNV